MLCENCNVVMEKTVTPTLIEYKCNTCNHYITIESKNTTCAGKFIIEQINTFNMSKKLAYSN